MRNPLLLTIVASTVAVVLGIVLEELFGIEGLKQVALVLSTLFLAVFVVPWAVRRFRGTTSRNTRGPGGE